MAVYHGTNADFTEFDLSKSSDTTKRYIDGFYFTTEEKVAKKIANLVVVRTSMLSVTPSRWLGTEATWIP